MITKQLIDDFQKELEDSYLIPRGRTSSLEEENYNKLLMQMIECCIKLKLYVKGDLR